MRRMWVLRLMMMLAWSGVAVGQEAPPLPESRNPWQASAPATLDDQVPEWPLVPTFMGRDPALNQKEWAGAVLAAEWINLPSKPKRGRDGRLIYVYGIAMPSVVCAPLQVCTLELEPGEQVQDVHLGDAAQWQVMPAKSGPEGAKITYVVIKPLEIGLVTSLFLTTDRRPYHIKLISRSKNFMPRVAFYYPEAMERQWAAYQQAKQAIRERNTLPDTGERLTDLYFEYDIEGKAPWKPVRVYHNGVKTYIQMPREMEQTEAPALMVLSGKKEQLVNYRLHGDRFVVDQVFEKAILVAGVGRKQTKIKIERK